MKQELTQQDLQDYGNHFNGLISQVRLGKKITNLKMPERYFQKKYPKRYLSVLIYPEVFRKKVLEYIINYFNKQVKKTKILVLRILKVVGYLIYQDPYHFEGAI